MERQKNNHEREWKSFYYQMGRRAVELSQADTRLFTHSEPYSHYDLVQSPQGLFLKSEHEELFNALEAEGFSRAYDEYPAPIHEAKINDHYQREVVAGAELILELESDK